MADGMFTTPEMIRAQRADDILKQYQAAAGMGGSMSGLLGQVAAAGTNVGNLMAESGARMFGLQTAEEKKAEELKYLGSVFDTTTPEGMRGMARQLNAMGMTEQALKLIGMADATETSDLTLQLQRKKVEDYQTSPDWDYGVVGEEVTQAGMRKVYGWYNKRTRQIDTNLPAPDSVPTPNEKPEIDFGGSNARPAGQ